MASYSAASNSIIQIVIRARLWDQVLMMVRHYRQQPASVAYSDGRVTLQEILTQYNASALLPYQAWLAGATTDVTFEFIDAQIIWPVRYAYESQPASTALGTGVPPTQMQNTAAVITMQSDGAGRSAHGGVHIAGLPQSAYDAGYLTPAGIATCQAIRDTLTTPITITTPAVTILPCIYTRSSPGDSQIITHGITMGTARVMRRRTVRVGI